MQQYAADGICLLKLVLGMRRDLPLLYDAATVNAIFNALPKQSNGFPANETLQAFLAVNFGTAGSDFEAAVPDDFSSEPDNFLPNVTEPAIRQWALAVNDLWQDLCREVCYRKECSVTVRIADFAHQWALAVNDLWQDLCREVWYHMLSWAAQDQFQGAVLLGQLQNHHDQQLFPIH